jgi:RimJ/RimL family protein N-acetyltransferase
LRLFENEGAGQQERVLERGPAVAIGDRQMELLVRAQIGQRHVVDRAGDRCAADDVDLEWPRHVLSAAAERLRHGDVVGRRADAERGGDRAAVDRQRVVRAVLALRKGSRAHREEGDGRPSEGPSEETHISNNVAGDAIVAIRPMRRADVDALTGWSHHDDPLFRHYNVPAMTRADADDLWRLLTADPAVRRPYAGLVGERVVATLMLRDIDAAAGGGELGIMLDPACLGQGLGRRILAAFLAVLAADGFRRVHLEVAGYNERAIAAYRAAGFTASDEYWAEPEPGVDIASLLEGSAAGAVRPNVRREPDGSYRTRIVRMERRLTTQSKDNVPL